MSEQLSSCPVFRPLTFPTPCRVVGQAFAEWQYQVWKAAALRRAAAFLTQRGQAAAFNTWRAFCEECKVERALHLWTSLTLRK